MLIAWRIVALLTMIPAAYSEYRIQIQGLFFTGPLIGVIFAELFCSGRLSDHIVTRLSQRNGGIRTPEMRLWLGYPGALLSAVGLAVWGASVQMGWHWIVGQVALFLFAVGLQAGNTTLTTYIVDSYPEHAIEVITFYSVVINVSAVQIVFGRIFANNRDRCRLLLCHGTFTTGQMLLVSKPMYRFPSLLTDSNLQ